MTCSIVSNETIKSIDRSARGIAWASPASRVQAILAPRVLADVVREIDPHNARGAGLGERGSSIALAAGDIQDPFAVHEVPREAVAFDVLPEDPGMAPLRAPFAQ